MNQITIVEIAGELVVDSRIIAEQLENDHESLLKLLKKHQVKIEAKCGHLRFEIGTVTNSVGAVNEVKFVWLNEKQSAALLNLCRNSDRAVDLKIDLASAYVDQKRQLEKPEDRALFEELAARVARMNKNPELEQRIQAIESHLFRSQSLASVPEISAHNLARKLVDQEAARTKIQHQYVWRQAYDELKYIHNYDVSKKRCKGSKLDQIEADGQLDNLIAIMQKLWQPQ